MASVLQQSKQQLQQSLNNTPGHHYRFQKSAAGFPHTLLQPPAVFLYILYYTAGFAYKLQQRMQQRMQQLQQRAV